MVRDRQHGPVVELNRIALRRSRAAGKQGPVPLTATVFAQMANKLSLLTHDVLMLPHRTWKVKFIGIDDQSTIIRVDQSHWAYERRRKCGRLRRGLQ